MTDKDLEEIATRLEADTPTEAARVDIQGYSDDWSIHLISNRAGFIRLAAECLKAAIAPLPPSREVLPVDWKYLFTKNSVRVDRVSRTESVELPPPPLKKAQRIKNGLTSIIGVAIILFVILSMIVGCFTIISKIR